MAMYSTTIASVGYKNVKLLKDQTLGIGSYGKVYRARCDSLPCAAKLIHETLFDPIAKHQTQHRQEYRLPIRRFEQECEFLNTIRHPNIIQYLGVHHDPDTGLPVLLMELMDDSLTHFLETSSQPIPYHIQVNFCHDISLALDFLHGNNIIHRDLSSNNILLIGNTKAKVTDFGMAKLGDLNPQASHFSNTMCPGTDVYMPPEAVKDKPTYTEKIDCFSFGVIIIQIMTQLFPQPGDRMKEVQISYPGLPSKTLMEYVPEVDRRQNHIGKVDPNHVLLSIALSCLKDTDIERPSARELCERVGALKENAEYLESTRAIDRDTQELQSLREQMRHLREKDKAKELEIKQLKESIQGLKEQLQKGNNKFTSLCDSS